MHDKLIVPADARSKLLSIAYRAGTLRHLVAGGLTEVGMRFIDTKDIQVVSRKPGWYGRQFDSPSMTFVHYAFDAGASIHRHAHEQEEVWHILEGELEISIGPETRRAGPGAVGIVPPNTEHEVKALTAGKAIVVDYPLREFGDG